MGSTLSCLAPNDSQGVNLSKKHPGRAEAIAEYKARKQTGKSKSEREEIAPVKVPEPTPIVADKSIAEKSPVEDVEEPQKIQDDDEVVEEVKEEIAEKSPEVELTKEEDKDVDKDAKIIDVEEEVAPKVAETEEPTDVPIEDMVEEVGDTQDVKEKGVEIESDKIEEVEKPLVEGESVEVSAPTEPEPQPVPEPLPLLEVEEVEERTPLAAEAALTTPTLLSPLISARRHIFEIGDDTIPEAKKLDLDVRDPVTGDMVTLEEYRRRQSERARGVVKEHVEKYESIDEKALKEIETLKLQEESRVKGREGSRNWTTPEPSSPSSPKPSSLSSPKPSPSPSSNKDFTIQTL